ncbi:MAG: restriction endonuclease subunit R [Nitrospinae bacterium RIFCSPLOWO2_12_FULL_45_22]|nr:MAG: restriction endonuclease subunit R [Nitrospinae bacterium RIFCSPLOWO2_12_FULL_45_22]
MDDTYINEAKTRQAFIDKALKQARWGPIIPFQPGIPYDHCSVEEYPTATGPADYVLFYKGIALACVEGKKIQIGPQNVLQQAKRYARGFPGGAYSFGEYHLPFVYSTNGRIIWFQDLRDPLNLSREVAAFHTPQALMEMLNKNDAASRKWLRENEIGNKYLWPFQIEAIRAIEQAVMDRRRHMLVAMATGTGKTFTMVNLIYRLMKSGYARRILFLVDRRALAAQAVTAMASFEAEPGLKFDQCYEVYSQRFRREDLDEDMKFDPKLLPTEYLTNPSSRDSFVYISTIQRMRINLFGYEGMFYPSSGDQDDDSDASKLDIPIHAFDVIIADECHRGYTAQEESKWREVLMHFDSIKIGLTATPAAHTTAFFKQIVYRYDYERAVREGYLVDYDAIAIQSDITLRGVFLKEGEEVGLVNTHTGQLVFEFLEDERELPAPTTEIDWTAPDRNRKIIQEIKKYFLEQEEQLGHFPKTLIFAQNDLPHISHCDQLIEILRDEFARGDDFVQKITGSPSVDRPLQKIREFRNRQNPGIVLTVDMLSTGVDVPRIENIVFLRPVKSRILFEQMMGRGTRRCDEIHKTHFTVFDCFNGTLLEYFRKTTGITAEAPVKSTRSIREIIQAIADNEDREYNIRVLSKRLHRISKNVTQAGRLQFDYILDSDIAEFAQTLHHRLEQEWEQTIKTMQSEDFLDLCENYPRPERKFIRTDTAEDYVNSRIIFRAKDGRELRPQDYLQEFEKFVRENPRHIEALEILLNRPQEFNTRQLKALRDTLSTQPDSLVDKFTEKNLRRAYNKELADIISMIRHAAKGGELLTAERRVDKALMKIKSGRSFTEDQENWLVLIRRHLIENLLLEKEDFDSLPIFTREGASWGKLNRVFDGKLETIIHEINQAIAA